MLVLDLGWSLSIPCKNKQKKKSCQGALLRVEVVKHFTVGNISTVLVVRFKTGAAFTAFLSLGDHMDTTSAMKATFQVLLNS